MIGRLFGRLRQRVREWWALDPPAERIEGSGEVYIDPAYNSQYTAERRLQALAEAQDDAEEERSVAKSPARLPPEP